MWMVQTFVFPHNFPISQAEGSHKSLLSGRVRGHWTIFKSSHRVTTQVNNYDWETWDGTFLGIFCGISSKSVFLTFLRNSLTGQKVTNLSKGRIHTALCPIPGKWLPLTRVCFVPTPGFLFWTEHKVFLDNGCPLKVCAEHTPLATDRQSSASEFTSVQLSSHTPPLPLFNWHPGCPFQNHPPFEASLAYLWPKKAQHGGYRKSWKSGHFRKSEHSMLSGRHL